MAERRAVEKDHLINVNGPLPVMYQGLTAIMQERHPDLCVLEERSYEDAAKLNAIPVACEEFAQVLKHYPILIAPGEAPTPVAIVGLRQGVNDQVDSDGSWANGRYIPAYLRRYPFLLVKENDTSDKQVLCADLSSLFFSDDPEAGNRLFNDKGEKTETADSVLDFCLKYEQAAARTAEVMKIATDLDLLETASINVTRDEQSARVEGFLMISEDKLRKLPDDKLADLARRGILAIFTAHHLSMSNFTEFAALP